MKRCALLMPTLVISHAIRCVPSKVKLQLYIMSTTVQQDVWLKGGLELYKNQRQVTLQFLPCCFDAPWASDIVKVHRPRALLRGWKLTGGYNCCTAAHSLAANLSTISQKRSIKELSCNAPRGQWVRDPPSHPICCQHVFVSL